MKLLTAKWLFIFCLKIKFSRQYIFEVYSIVTHDWTIWRWAFWAEPVCKISIGYTMVSSLRALLVVNRFSEVYSRSVVIALEQLNSSWKKKKIKVSSFFKLSKCQKQSPGGVLLKAFTGKFCKIIEKHCNLVKNRAPMWKFSVSFTKKFPQQYSIEHVCTVASDVDFLLPDARKTCFSCK